MIKLIALGIASIIGSIAYRFGGSEHGKRFVRPLVISLLTVGSLWIMCGFHWSLILVMGLTYATCTTYWDFINHWFDEDESEYWWNWALHGLFIGLSVFPYCIFQGHWLAFGVRSFVCALLITLWSELIGNATLEELGRGFIIISTLSIFLFL